MGGSMPNPRAPRRGFLQHVAGVAGFYGLAAAPANAQGPQRQGSGDPPFLSRYARAQNYKSLKQSSFDRTGGNADYWPMAPGATQEVFNSSGPGVITHIWFTIAADSDHHLKEIVLRAYWDGNTKPSIEVPVGDFFGLNLGQYFVYQSAFLNCSSIKALNSYFAMPFHKSARLTATGEALVPTSVTPDFERLCEEEFRVAADAAYENLDREVAGINAHFGSMGHILSTDLGETVKQAVLRRFDLVLKAFDSAYLDKWREDSKRPFADEDVAWLNLQVTGQLEVRAIGAEGKCNAYLCEQSLFYARYWEQT